MSKPIVERYEQILAQDPTSTAFVELAKALIDRGEHSRAIEVCRGGLEHHRDSVIGRVLWGKALIHAGRPAEAMEQFDRAISIDRDNVHAYTLVGEVLLRKGLYRSALPLFKKASALKPGDGRVRDWLQQTQKALEHGAPVDLGDTFFEPPAELADKTNDQTAPFDAPDLGAGRDIQRTEVLRAPSEAELSGGAGRRGGKGDDVPLDVVEGLTSTFDALKLKESELAAAGLSMGTPQAPSPSAPRPAQSGGAGGSNGGPPVLYPAGQAPRSEPTIIPSPELMQEVRVEVLSPESRRRGGLLDEVVSLPFDSPGSEAEPPPPSPPPAPSPPRSDESPYPPAEGEQGRGLKSLLADIPDLEEERPVEPPRPVEAATMATEAIAKEYERELRAKLESTAQKKTYLQRHGSKLAVGIVLGLALLAGLSAWIYVRTVNRGRDVKDALAFAKKSIAMDTRESYREAIDSLSLALKMDSSQIEAWALSAYAGALLYADQGGTPEDRARANEALARPGVREAFPAVALAVDYYLAEGKAREAATEAVLSSNLEAPEVHEAAGRILLRAKKHEQALTRLARAVELMRERNATSVRALVAVGDYYREFRDFENALKFYGGPAEQFAPHHPERVLGTAEVRLELDQDLDAALKEVEGLSKPEAFGAETQARYALVLGRLLSRAGQDERALKLLVEGAERFKKRGFEFQMALGEASRRAGKMDKAQTAFEAATRLAPKDEDAKESLGRVLVARDRDAEAVKLSTEGDGDRRLALVRAIAYGKLGEWKSARAELQKTQVGGKFPAEAGVQLALADAAQGDAEKAQEVLEKYAAGKKVKSFVRLALGKVYWQRGILDKAKVQFEEAAKDPDDWEGYCALGRLLARVSLFDLAIEPLSKSVKRNGSHGEARSALIRAYLAVGKLDDAIRQAEAWTLDSPSMGAAHRDQALAFFHAGRAKEADAAVSRALKLAERDPEAHRLRAQISFAKGEAQQAFSALERANKLNPKDADTFCAIGDAFMRKGVPANAQKAYEAAQREDPKSVCGAAGAVWAELPQAAKGSAKSLTSLLSNVRGGQDKAFLLMVQSRAQLAAGQPKEARDAANEALAIAPNDGFAQLALGMAAARQREDGVARTAFEKAARLDPANSGVHLAFGEWLERRAATADKQAAVDHLEAFVRIGGAPADVARVKKSLANLKKKLAQR